MEEKIEPKIEPKIKHERPRYYWRKPLAQEDQIKKLNEVKWQLCHLINKHTARYNMTRARVAYEMQTSNSCASKVLNYKVAELSLSQLFKYWVRLNPRFKILISPY